MELISHRINSVGELEKTPTKYGVEVDLRDFGDEVVLSHDPFIKGENFEDFLKHYRHGTLIANIKSERIEHRVLEFLKKYGIKDYFLLDCSFPMIYLLSNLGETNLAVRFSEFESLESVLACKNRAKWVWVDCFTRLPIDVKSYAVLKQAGFKLCLVSPELQNQDEKIEPYRAFLESNNIKFDAICTKERNFKRWQ